MQRLQSGSDQQLDSPIEHMQLYYIEHMQLYYWVHSQHFRLDLI
jgi:hypothetical protein